MDLLCLAGSPRKGGNSDILMDAFISGAGDAGLEIEKLYIADLKISPCTSCGRCREVGECVIKDDMAQIYPRLLNASAISISTPVYFRGPSAQVKTLIDRCQALWVKRFILDDLELRRRPGFIIATAAQKEMKAFECSKNILKAFFATLSVTCEAELCYPGLEEKGAILKDRQAIEEITELGSRLKEWLDD